LVQSLRENYHSENIGVDASVILKWISGKFLGCELGSSGREQGAVAGFCEHSNESSGSIKDGKFQISTSEERLCCMEFGSY
jgi:hypothetical protein